MKIVSPVAWKKAQFSVTSRMIEVQTKAMAIIFTKPKIHSAFDLGVIKSGDDVVLFNLEFLIISFLVLL